MIASSIPKKLGIEWKAGQMWRELSYSAERKLGRFFSLRLTRHGKCAYLRQN
jgi:hypothetical protein